MYLRIRKKSLACSAQRTMSALAEACRSAAVESCIKRDSWQIVYNEKQVLQEKAREVRARTHTREPSCRKAWRGEHDFKVIAA